MSGRYSGKMGKLLAGAFFVVIGICAAWMMSLIIVDGPGISPDSVVYIDVARNFISGNGLVSGNRPLTHFPPGYPLLLVAASGLVENGDIFEAGKLLCAIFFGTNLSLLGFTVFLSTNRSVLASSLAMCAFLASGPVISSHAMVWSEAPFMTFSLLAFILISLHLKSPRKSFLLPASFSLGYAMIIRYTGVTLLIPFFFGLFFFGQQSMKEKIRHSIPAIFIALVPLFLWLTFNIITAGSATNRSAAIHFFSARQAGQLISTIYDFIFPVNMSGWYQAVQLVLILALFLGLTLFLHRKNHLKLNDSDVRTVLPALWTVFMPVYVIFLIISISFFDAQTPLDHRILLPVYIAFVISALSMSWSFIKLIKRPWVGFSLISLLLLSIILNAIQAVPAVRHIHENGVGYASIDWKTSQTIASVSALPEDLNIYTNGPDAVLFLTGRSVNSIPRVWLKNLDANPEFNDQFARMCDEICDSTAVLVYFNKIERWFLPTLGEMQSGCTMPLLNIFEDGYIYGYNGSTFLK